MHKFKGLNGHSKKDKVTYWHGSWRWMCWSFLLPTDLWPSSLSLRFIRSGSFLVSYELMVIECVCFKLLRNCTLTRWLSWISLIDHVTLACLIGYHQVSSSVEHSHYLFIYFEHLITEGFFFFCCWCFCWPRTADDWANATTATGVPETDAVTRTSSRPFLRLVLIDSHTVALLDASHCRIQLTFNALKSISHVHVFNLMSSFL